MSISCKTFIESLRLEKTTKIPKSNPSPLYHAHWPHPSVPHLHGSGTPPGMVTPPPSWAAVPVSHQVIRELSCIFNIQIIQGSGFIIIFFPFLRLSKNAVCQPDGSVLSCTVLLHAEHLWSWPQNILIVRNHSLNCSNKEIPSWQCCKVWHYTQLDWA